MNDRPCNHGPAASCDTDCADNTGATGSQAESGSADHQFTPKSKRGYWWLRPCVVCGKSREERDRKGLVSFTHPAARAASPSTGDTKP